MECSQCCFHEMKNTNSKKQKKTTKKNKCKKGIQLLHLLLEHNALQLPCYFFVFFPRRGFLEDW